MFRSLVIIFCLLSTITASLKLGAENFNNNWVPLNLTQSSYENRSVQETLENILKQAQHTQTINIDLIRENAIRLVSPPAKTQKRVTVYFSTPNINEDIDFSALKNKEDFGHAKTFLREEPFQPLNTGKKNTRDSIETNAELEKAKSNPIDYLEVYGFPKFVNNSASDGILSTELPSNITVTTSKYFDSSELPKIERFTTSEALNGNSFENLQRTSKQMHSKDFVNEIMDLESIKEAESSTYLISVMEKYVTEPTTTTTTTTEAREDTTEVKKGYFYKQPVVVPLPLAASRNALTSKLLENLAKYHIKLDDVLSNYEESKFRINNHDSTFRKTFHPQISPLIYIPFKYNSLNHLPVNPLLAAFLSNYGVYLRGAFGRPNDYRNLYGYSASNNIHNNKPFGSYKIYSDTDSSN